MVLLGQFKTEINHEYIFEYYQNRSIATFGARFILLVCNIWLGTSAT